MQNSVQPTGTMSLRFQVNIRILFCFICILILSGSIAVWQARKAVSDEVDASIKLALQLINLGFSTAPASRFNESRWFADFALLKETRHLTIQLKKPSGEVIDLARKKHQTERNKTPPAWFVNLVAGDYPQAEHQLITGNDKPLTLIIQADPLDEITEVWQESLSFFTSIFLLTSLTFLAVNLVFNKAFRAITTIVEGLQLIETGHYQHKLPQFSTNEYDNIAKAINHMTEVLDKTRRENRALTQHSLEIQEEERQRLAQELHDELGQSLTAIKVMAVSATCAKVDVKQVTRSIIDICDHLTAVVRSMMHQLHPLILTELGLKAALEDMVHHWSKIDPALSLSIHCADRVDHLEKKLSIQIFRVIQECLTNIIRHADAQQVSIDLDIAGKQGEMLQLQITDDGRGCNLEQINSGFGLLGMQERIKSLNGEFSVRSRPLQGMSVTALIPLS